MSDRIEQLLRNNQAFVAAQLALDPGYFDRLSEGQHPEFLWIGCSDSRVPPDRITGHYGCGGVKAAMGDADHGLIDNWLRVIKDTQDYFWPQLGMLDEAARFRRLVELNVIEQVYNLAKTHVIQDAWKLGRRPMLHGWVFDLASGLLHRHTGEIDGNHAIHEVCKFHGAGAGAPP
jgi:carbonic anhydrase